MQQNYESACRILNASGFQLNTIDELLNSEQLQMTNPSGITLLDFLSLQNEPSVQELQNDMAFKSLLIHSLQHQQLPISPHWNVEDDFTVVRCKDSKIIHQQISNGLFYYCVQYATEHKHPFQSIIRATGNRALLFALDKPERHLTIDEMISSLSNSSAVNTFAHVTYQKADYIFRFYFNQQFELVKTTAVKLGKEDKILVHDFRTFNLADEDYLIGLELLQELSKKQHNKIQSLDYTFTPKFLFASTSKILAECRQLIQEINALKSPVYDRRERILQKLGDVDFNVSQSQESAMVSTNTPVVSTESQIEAYKQKKKNISKAKKSDIPIEMRLEKEIQCLLRLIDEGDTSIGKSKSLFVQMQYIQYLLIESENKLSIKQRTSLNGQIQQISNQMIDFIHKAFKDGKLTFLDALYDSCGEFIDGLLLGLIEQFQESLLKNANPGDLSQEMTIQMLDLIMHYYDKNLLYKLHLELLPMQLGVNLNHKSIYCSLIKIIIDFNHPNFVRFLIQKNIITPTDCIGIVQGKYMSLYQFLLICIIGLHEDYISLLEEFQSSNISILQVSSSDTLKCLTLSPENVLVQTNCSPKKSRLPQLQNDLFTNISNDFKDASPFSMLDFAQDHAFYAHNLPFSKIIQNILLKSPGLGFIYLAQVLCKNEINRRVFHGDRNRFEIFQSNLECENHTKLWQRKRSESQGICYLFYPSEHATPEIAQSFQNTAEFAQRLKQQDYMHSETGLPNWIAALYHEIVLSCDINKKMTGIMAIQMYMIFLPNWTAEMYKRYCFYGLARVDALQSAQKNPKRICLEIEAIIKSILHNPNPESLEVCLQFIRAKLDKLAVLHPDYQELRISLFR